MFRGLASPHESMAAHSPRRSNKVLALRDLPDPAPKTGEVLIRSEGFGLNYADVMAVKGLYRDAPPPPCIIGYETVGRVEQCGEGVPADLLGKRVLAMTRFGGYAQLACTDHRAVAEIPDDTGLGEALAMATQGATAWYMAMVTAPLQTGSSRVGSQCCRWRRPIAYTDRSAPAIARCTPWPAGPKRWNTYEASAHTT
jgi:NADPH:quinone reductase-like Zn-dependent oxidoreductase